MLGVSIIKENGNFIEDETLARQLLMLHKGDSINYDGHRITLEDLSVRDDRNYLHIRISDDVGVPESELHDNMDRVDRHNVGGIMNRPSKMQEEAYDV